MSTLQLLAHYCDNKDDNKIEQYYKSNKLFQGLNTLVTNFPSHLFISQNRRVNIPLPFNDYSFETVQNVRHCNSYIRYLFDLYMEDELNFLRHCELLNRNLENHNDCISSLEVIVAKILQKYFSRQNDIKCLQCIQTLFDNIKLFTKDVVTFLFYRMLIDRMMDMPMSKDMLNSLTLDILKTFLPYIDIQKVINITPHIFIHTDLEKALGIFNGRTIETVNLAFILLNTETYDCLEYMISQGYNFYHPKLGYNFEWEASHISKPSLGLSRITGETPESIYKTLVPETVQDKYLNMLKIYRLITKKELTEEELTILEKTFTSIDFTLTYDYNVSPYVMCHDKRVIELFKRYDVNLSNDNGRFYIQCCNKWILEFMFIGVDPRPSIDLYNRHIKNIPNNDTHKEERDFFQGRLEELIETYKLYKLKIYEETKNNNNICNDILKFMIGEYL
jgi:hypothetical protein